MNTTPYTALAITLTSALAACSAQDPQGIEAEPSAERIGQLKAALTLPTDTSDVMGMSYTVVEAGESCGVEPVAEQIVDLEEEALPAHLDGDDGDGDGHAFADAFFVLEPGDYRVCAAPLQADGSVSEECDPTSGEVTVMAESTTEIALVSQCEGPANGAADIITELNHPPLIEDLELSPSKFITTCETVTLTATATDEDGDSLEYEWSIEEVPYGASAYELDTDANVADFTPDIAGDFELQVMVTDAHDATTSLSFPIHVSQDSCDAAEPDAGAETDGGEETDAGASEDSSNGSAGWGRWPR